MNGKEDTMSTDFNFTFTDFFGDGEHCINCGELWTDDGHCPACRAAGKVGAAQRQLAHLQTLGDETGAANVRDWITKHEAAAANAEALWQRLVAHEHLTYAELHLLEARHWIEATFDDPESNRPTGFFFTRDTPRGDGDPYADQKSIEERAPDMRL